MANCSFCNSENVAKMHVTNKGQTLFFCSKKCQDNVLKYKRDPRKFKWASKEKVVEVQ